MWYRCAINSQPEKRKGWAIRWREIEIAPDGSKKRVLRYERLGEISRKDAAEKLAQKLRAISHECASLNATAKKVRSAANELGLSEEAHQFELTEVRDESASCTTISEDVGGTIFLVLVLAMVGLLVRALAIGEWAGVLFLIGFAALFVWQIGSFIRRNRPIVYSFDHLPGALLP